MQKPSQVLTGLLVTEKNRLGDMAEQYVKLLSHWKGCEVFQNVGCTGPTDIVIIHPELGSLQVDVKCCSWNEGRNRWETPNISKVPDHVTLVYVYPQGDFSKWKVSWRQAREKVFCPAGWENFWTNDDRIYSTNPTKLNETHQAAS